MIAGRFDFWRQAVFLIPQDERDRLWRWRGHPEVSAVRCSANHEILTPDLSEKRKPLFDQKDFDMVQSPFGHSISGFRRNGRLGVIGQNQFCHTEIGRCSDNRAQVMNVIDSIQ